MASEKAPTAHLGRVHCDEQAARLAEPLEPRAQTGLRAGCAREYNARCGLDDTHAMIHGTGC